MDCRGHNILAKPIVKCVMLAILTCRVDQYSIFTDNICLDCDCYKAKYANPTYLDCVSHCISKHALEVIL